MCPALAGCPFVGVLGVMLAFQLPPHGCAHPWSEVG